ncbi:MAG: DUF1292 domain-containing protein [bacterium]|nr:DUF1292 domain-containing protein [Mycoplasmatota bacterium]MDD6756929.1 DUF1292 domain-containing protein [bacterium]MDY2908051.1 hypothetical protein [Candidatus Faecimonas sp.]
MDNKEMAELIDIDGLSSDVEIVTYLNSEDNKRQYVVYTKEEIQEQTGNQVIYIAKIIPEGNVLRLEEITDDLEWIDVQHLLKAIANAQVN